MMPDARCGNCVHFKFDRRLHFRKNYRMHKKTAGFDHIADRVNRNKKKLALGYCTATVPFWAEPELEQFPPGSTNRAVYLNELDGTGCPAFLATEPAERGQKEG